MTQLSIKDEHQFDIFLHGLLTELQAYQAHVLQLYSSAGSSPKLPLSHRISDVTRIREGLLSAKSCNWGRFIHIFDDPFRR